ncbi:alanine racemase [Nocardioides mangrovicus]|uniref:Alanine racemase n=1 Tax=Nocardioides mangrovicus TaxID=2478913 RepID=A0A3L8P7U7_9ACTN|nr:alanine racemase [Nocardioides mangrovicus]RLV50689.1 alanine racemase [Nocardioides mangrovicus]
MAEILVDLDAVRHNVARLREVVAPAQLMVVVKADGYGHGMVAVARAAREAGADWLAVATPDEAVALRGAGDEGPLLCWLATPDQDYRPAVRFGVTLTAYDVAQLGRIVAAGATDVQLKVDTGLSRGGSTLASWAGLVSQARDLAVSVSGVWSHLACSDEPEHPANDAQEQAFREALATAEELGVDPGLRHLANSAAALLRPGSRFDAVRVGIATYGLTPAPQVASSADLGLRPAMTVRTELALVKPIVAGAGVSYGHTFVADRPMEVAVVPLGYGDGVPRHASSRAEVLVRGSRCPVLGRVCMDQLVVDVTGLGARAGDEVVLFGPGDAGEPLAQDWAEACGTISYEIVTRIGGTRVDRAYRGVR